MGALLVSIPSPHLHVAHSLCKYLAQPILLRRAQHSPHPSTTRPLVLIQHHMGRNEEGSREVQLLARGTQDPPAVLARAFVVLCHLRRHGCPLDGSCPAWMADPRNLVGRHIPPSYHAWVPYPLSCTFFFRSSDVDVC